jgi:hypothetical protein
VAVHCPWCKSFDLGAGFDSYQCFSCGGHLKLDGTPTVPTSAVETASSTYDGPGAELVEDPDNPPYRAQNAVR